MTALSEARKRIEVAREMLERLDPPPSPVLFELDLALKWIDSVRSSCLHCGGENGRAGDYCSDRCRAAHYREHMPCGTVKSVRRLAADKVAIVVHYAPEEAASAVALRIGATVHLAQEVDP